MAPWLRRLENSENDMVCHAGAGTGGVRCGLVKKFKKSYQEPNGTTVIGQVEVDFSGRCDVTGGDSGGPVFTATSDGVLARGLTGAAVKPECTPTRDGRLRARKMLFSPIARVEGKESLLGPVVLLKRG